MKPVQHAISRAIAVTVTGVMVGCGPVLADPSWGADGSGEGGSSTTDATPGHTSTFGPTTTDTATSAEPTSADAGWDVPADCMEVTVEARFLRPQVVLVLDRSSSMNGPTVFEGQQTTRWSALYRTVESLVQTFDTRADFGAELFPRDDHVCQADEPITVAPVPQNGMTVLATIPGPDDETNGNTPLGSGVDVALRHLQARPGEQPRAMVLVADGDVSEFCDGPNQAPEVVATLEQGYADGIPTYVVAIGGGGGQLGSFAEAGGVPNGETGYYDAEDGDLLQAALEGIMADVVGCTVEIGQLPNHPDHVEVTIGGQPYPRVDDCDLENGWTFAAAGHDRLVLCNDACAALEQSGIIEVFLGCP